MSKNFRVWFDKGGRYDGVSPVFPKWLCKLIAMVWMSLGGGESRKATVAREEEKNKCVERPLLLIKFEMPNGKTLTQRLEWADDAGGIEAAVSHVDNITNGLATKMITRDDSEPLTITINEKSEVFINGEKFNNEC